MNKAITINTHYLKSGELFFAEESTIIETFLGPCVALCVFDLVKRVGGICQFKVPGDNSTWPVDATDNNQAIFAIPNLLREFKKRGSRPENLVLKLVGGTSAGKEQRLGKVIVASGQENIKAAHELIASYNLKIVAESIGGQFGRQLRFFTETGEIQIKKIELNLLADKEKESSLCSEATQVEIGPDRQVHILKATTKIKVMIVDDSTPIRMILRKMIEMNSKLVVIGEAKSAAEAEALMAKELPDVITLDINMPEVDGVTFLRKMMQEKPIPTIMISALNYLESGPVFEALELGAFDYMKKPAFEDLQHISGELHEKIIAAYTSKYVGRISKANNLASFKSPLVVSGKNLDDYILAIGASTGGTKALSDLLTQLPNTVPPIIITQHIPPVFSKAFAERLNQLCKFSVKEAEDGDVLKASQAFIAPGGRHMKVVYQNSKYIIKITDDEPVNRFRPSVDYMFNSLIQHDKLGKKVIALLLTGMGRDGAEGLLKLKELGAKTAAQDESSCVVYGMPKVAYELGAVDEMLSLQDMPKFIVKHLNR